MWCFLHAAAWATQSGESERANSSQLNLQLFVKILACTCRSNAMNYIAYLWTLCQKLQHAETTVWESTGQSWHEQLQLLLSIDARTMPFRKTGGP